MSSQLERHHTVLVQEAYSAAARDPDGEHAFAVGKQLAVGVGYPHKLLDRMPEAAVAAFAGVATASMTALLHPGRARARRRLRRGTRQSGGRGSSPSWPE